MVLMAKLDDTTTVYVSPIAAETYAEHFEDDVLGGDAGYFLLRLLTQNNTERLEILAKAPSFDAASNLFDLIVTTQRRQHRPDGKFY